MKWGACAINKRPAKLVVGGAAKFVCKPSCNDTAEVAVNRVSADDGLGLGEELTLFFNQ